MAYQLRSYQQKAVNAGLSFFQEESWYNALMIITTGAGKSLIIANIAAGLSGNVLIFQPSKEILEQNYKKFTSYGFRAGIYSASGGSKFIDTVTFATIGSVAKKHHLFKKVKYIIVDEAHLCNAESGMYQEFISNLSHAKVLGLTATPYRLTAGFDGAMLKFLTTSTPRIFNKVIYYIQNEVLFNEGHLAPLEYYNFNLVDRNMLSTNSSGTDFTDASIRSYYRKIDMPSKTAEYANKILKKRRSLLVFCSLIEEACKVSSKIPGSVVITGETEKSEREKILSDFTKGRIRCLINVGVLTCLSDETEVLTKRGWLKKNEVTLDDLVAQYENGEIIFEKPSHKHEHKHFGNMVTVDSRYVTFNVTDDHDMLVKTGSNLKFYKQKSRNIVGRKLYIPVSGFCEPDKITVPQKPLIKKGRFIAQNSYNYRKSGITKSEANKIALEQWEIKSSLKYKNPDELTLDECRLIGFWIGDGTGSKAPCGGFRYSLTQSFKTPKMLEWIESLLTKCNIHYCFKDYKGGSNVVVGVFCNTSGYRRYTLSIGTGGNKQNVSGLYSLIPYLQKRGTPLLNGLNREQYFALMEGLFKADGWHGDNKSYAGGKIVGENKELFDQLQAIGVCRGYRVTIKPVKMRKNNKKQLYNISLYDKTQHQLTNDRAISTPANGQNVWCLTMSKGTLVTRNNGTVTIMGNTGFDYPALEAVLIARSTMSLALYYQIVGRVMRPFTYPDGTKKTGWVVDLGGNLDLFGKIETMKIVQNSKGGYYITNNGRQLTDTPFTKSA